MKEWGVHRSAQILVCGLLLSNVICLITREPRTLGTSNGQLMSRIHLSLFIASAFIACSEQDNTPFEAPITAKASEGLFVARSAKDTGIDFVNSVPRTTNRTTTSTSTSIMVGCCCRRCEQ